MPYLTGNSRKACLSVIIKISLITHQYSFSLKAELAEIQEKSRLAGGRYVQNQQLEDLRNLQESLTKEKKLWQQKREEEEKEMELKRQSLFKTQVNNLRK